MALFDDIQRAAFGATATVFADVATWTSTDTKATVTANVFFKNPNDPIKIGEQDKIEYRPYDFSIEFYETDFVGLKALTDKCALQKVSVKGYILLIREVRQCFDGKTYIAYGEEVIDE
jgi:hypothetical protein